MDLDPKNVPQKYQNRFPSKLLCLDGKQLIGLKDSKVSSESRMHLHFKAYLININIERIAGHICHKKNNLRNEISKFRENVQED